MIAIICATTFDITFTGTTGYFQPHKLPYKDSSGQLIESNTAWNHSRNQQRNFETISQIISLRTQIFEIVYPIRRKSKWYFEFSVEDVSVYGSESDPFDVLKSDARNGPMIVYHNQSIKTNMLVVEGIDQNVWFWIKNDKYR
jgi:hypothetical protein